MPFSLAWGHLFAQASYTCCIMYDVTRNLTVMTVYEPVTLSTGTAKIGHHRWSELWRD